MNSPTKNADKTETQMREVIQRLMKTETLERQRQSLSARLSVSLVKHWWEGFIEALGFPTGRCSTRKTSQQATTVTKPLFNSWLQDDEMMNILDKADIEASDKFALFDVLDVDLSGELSLEEAVHGLMSMRGVITKSDVVAIRLKTLYLTKMIEELYQKSFGRLMSSYGYAE